MAEPDEMMLALFGALPTAAGAVVTSTGAMKVPAVNAAVRAISETIGELPVKTRKRLDGGGKEDADDHPSYALVHDDANDWTSAAQLRTQLTTDALLHDDGFAYVNRVEGKPIEFIRLDPIRTRIKVDERTGEPSFEFSETSGGKRTYGFRDVLHIPCHSIDGIRGYSPVKAGREAIGLALILEAYASRLFGNGARPAGVIEVPGKLGDEGLKKMKAGWTAAHAGAENAGKTAVLWDGAKFNPMALSSVDAQFLEMRAHQISEIARLFRVPPVLLMDYGRATWSNSAEMGQQFLTYTLLPWLRTWEAAYRRVLLSDEERRTHAIEFIVDDLLRANIGDRFEAYGKAIASRFLNPNEVRAMESRAPYEGGEKFENPNTSTTGGTNGTP